MNLYLVSTFGLLGHITCVWSGLLESAARPAWLIKQHAHLFRAQKRQVLLLLLTAGKYTQVLLGLKKRVSVFTCPAKSMQSE